MHEFYAANQAKFKKDMDQLLKPIADELIKETGRTYPQLFEEVWDYYRSELLEKFPYIGGNQVSGTRNLTGAYCYIALGVVCRKYGVSLERWGYLITLAYERYFDKIPNSIKKLTGMLLSKPKLVNKMLRKKDAKNAANARKNPGSFETQTQEPTAEYTTIYHTTVCPLANFAKEYGYMEYMPYICNLDYVMFASFGLPFYREKTCAAGDGCCDFKFKPGAPIVPAWPCHATDENDPLS